MSSFCLASVDRGSLQADLHIVSSVALASCPMAILSDLARTMFVASQLEG